MPTVTSRSCSRALSSAATAVCRNAAGSGMTQSACSDSTSASGSRRCASSVAQRSAGPVEAARGSTRMLSGGNRQRRAQRLGQRRARHHQDPLRVDEPREAIHRRLRGGARAGEREQLLRMRRAC